MPWSASANRAATSARGRSLRVRVGVANARPASRAALVTASELRWTVATATMR